MSPEDRHGIEQLDALAAELTEAGQIARAAVARREVVNPAFAARLRARLLDEPAQVGPEQLAAALVVPTPPVRDQIAPRRLADRRNGNEKAPQRLAPDAGKRWRARQIQAIPANRPGVPALVEPLQLDAERSDQVVPLKPSVRWRMPTGVKPARWVAVGLAASIAIGALLYGGTVLFPVRPEATVDVAVAATIVRSGISFPLAAGAQLNEGDEIKVGPGGQATIAMSGSFVRMAAGSDVRLNSLAAKHIVVDQLGGRAYHRAQGMGGDYQVVTASVTWVATGTAFDLDRRSSGAGGEEVRGLALLDGLDLQGPKLSASLTQGQSARVEIATSGSLRSEPVIEQISRQTLADSWLVGNAHLDMLAGLDLGELAVDVGPTPQPAVTPVPTAATAVTPRLATPAIQPTKQPTAAPTRKPNPRPTPAGPASLGKLTIKNNGDGTYKFSWPKYTGVGFSFYKLVYGDAGTAPNYPTSPYWACNETRDATTWTGPIDVGDYAVRVQVVDESSGLVIRAQTGLVHLKVSPPAPTLPPLQSLGALSVSDDGSGNYTFSWAPYVGGWDFDAYKLVYLPGTSNPSYLNGDPYQAFGTGATSGTLPLTSGDWSVRVQAVGHPAGHAHVFAQSAVYHLTVP